MDQITNTPGLQHITEDILLNLDFKNLKVCQSVNKTFGEILANPIFWLKKFRLITKSPKNQKDWIKVITSEKNSEKKKILNLVYINLQK